MAKANAKTQTREKNESKGKGKEEGMMMNDDVDVRKRVGLALLGVIEPCGVNSVDEVAEWEVLEMAVDSGAGETVIGEEMIGAVKAVPGEAQKKGVRYEVADGTLLANLGEKRFEVICEGARGSEWWRRSAG